MNKRLLSLLTVLCSTAGMVSGGASASEEFMEEIVVTAQKREEAVTDVPITIQATSGEFLNAHSVKNLSEFVHFVPGMNQKASLSSAHPDFQIRSITQSAGAGDPTVGWYIGDAPFYYPQQIVAPMTRTVGLDRIEVLKGPQSTLYGNGAMGGVVRVIPKAPNLESFEGSLLVGYTDLSDGESGHSADISLSIPIIQDKLGIRLTAGDEDVGGWINLQPHALNFATFGYEPVGDPLEDYGGLETSDYRLQVLAEPNERMTLKLMAINNETEVTPTSGLQVDKTDPPTSRDSVPGQTGMESNYDFVSGTFSYEFDRVTLTSVFTQLDYQDRFDSSFISRFGLNIVVAQDADSFSNETRLVSNLDGPWQWIVGLYYVDADNEQFVQVPSFLGSPAVTQTSSYDSEQRSAFAEVSYEFFEGELTALFGLRYFEDDRSSGEDANLFPFPLPVLEDTFDSVNPRFNLAYTPDENSLYFLNIAKGFRSGMFNSVSRCITIPQTDPRFAACLEPIDSDELWSYEFGMKRTLLDGRLVVDGTVYFQDWQNLQGGGAGGGTIATALSHGDADGIGVDLAISWFPESVPGLNLNLGANWHNMEYSSLNANAAAAFGDSLQKGDSLASAPDFSTTLSASYGRQLSSNIFGQFSLSWNHIAEHIARKSNPIGSDELDFVNVRAGVLIGENLGVHVYSTNVTDEDGIVWRLDDQVVIGTPRLLGLEVSYDF